MGAAARGPRFRRATNVTPGAGFCSSPPLRIAGTSSRAEARRSCSSWIASRRVGPATSTQRCAGPPSRSSRLRFVISFARGAPAPECLPVQELADCAKAALERDGVAVLSYGPGGGYGPLREWIAQRHGVEPSRVLLTSGSLQGFVFLAATLVTPGARVLVEAPTYDP